MEEARGRGQGMNVGNENSERNQMGSKKLRENSLN